MAAALSSYTVVVPGRVLPGRVVPGRVLPDRFVPGHTAGPARRVDNRPSTQVFLRRRLLVAVVFIAVFVALTIGAGSVLANRGGAPASTSAVRPAPSSVVQSSVVQSSVVQSYVVQPGDTVWSIAEQLRGGASQVDYVDALVSVLGDASLQVGQVITLP